MSFKDQWEDARTVLLSHIVAAWSPALVEYGTVSRMPSSSQLPYAVLSWENVTIAPETPTVNRAEFPVTITGAWDRDNVTGHLEDYALARIEELRNRIDDDPHLILTAVGTVTDAGVTGIDMVLPSGVDPSDQRVYVTLTVSLNMPFNR